MKTKNKRLLDKETNKEYYSHSDSQWMDPKMATRAHLILNRVKWVREWVHKVGSRYHLDCGCKDGYLCLTLASEGVECVGIDPSIDAIDEAKLRSKENDLDITFKVSTVEDLEARFRFDTVSLMEVLEHVIDPEGVIRKVSSLGTIVLITTPDANGRHGLKDSEQNEEHLRLYTKEELDKLINGIGGEIIESVIRDDQLCIIYKSKVL